MGVVATLVAIYVIRDDHADRLEAERYAQVYHPNGRNLGVPRPN